MLTGDNRRTAEAIGRQLGLSGVIAGVLPQDKESEIRRLQQSGRRVAMHLKCNWIDRHRSTPPKTSFTRTV